MVVTNAEFEQLTTAVFGGLPLPKPKKNKSKKATEEKPPIQPNTEAPATVQ
jgi:hypothetical protein